MSTTPAMEALIREGQLTAQEAAHLDDTLGRAADQAWEAAGPSHPAEPMPGMAGELSGLAAGVHDATLATGMREPGETRAEFLDRTDNEPAAEPAAAQEPAADADPEPEMEAGS